MATKPNFFIVGAPKCGTTAMSEYLRTHPDVFFSKPKEIHFFHPEFEVGSWSSGYIKTLDEYLSLFEGAGGCTAVGEGSASYMSSPEAIENIMKFNSEAKLIAMVRNPIDMFHSFYWERYLSGYKETAKTPEEAWRLQEVRRRGEQIPKRGRGIGEKLKFQYGELCSLGHQLEEIYKRVPREQVHVVFFDDLKNDTRETYEETLAFLELEPDCEKLLEPKNTRVSRSSPWLTLIHKRIYKLKKQLGIKTSSGLLAFVSRIDQHFTKKRHMEPLRPEFKNELVEYFRDDIRKLEKLEGRDLSHWLS